MTIGDSKTELTEREMVREAQIGDRSAFKTLYDLYRDRVYTAAYYSLRDSLAAEDTLQTVFLKVHRRIDLRPNFSRYVHGELRPARLRKIEDHLFDCGECRARLARVQATHTLASQLPREAPFRDPWDAIEAALLPTRSRRPAGEKRVRPARLKSFLRSHSVALSLGVIAAVLILALALALGRHKESYLVAKDALDLREFHPVSIAEMERTTRPHVVAEGYVSEMRINDEDGDLSFKLVDDLGQAGPFIVCEIIDPIRVEPPSIGSRVRVYGVSRYDNQRNHNWYEVHPVLGIEVVRH